MKNIKLISILLILTLVLFDVLLLYQNNSKGRIIEKLSYKIQKMDTLERKNSLREKEFELSISNKNFLTALKENENHLLFEKRIVIYVPESACGVCIEKLFNLYWDDYLKGIAEKIIIFYENKHLKNTYYIGEKLVAHKKIEKYGFDNTDLISIYFLNSNQEFIKLYLFDVEYINSFKAYIEPFSNHLQKTQNR